MALEVADGEAIHVFITTCHDLRRSFRSKTGKRVFPRQRVPAGAKTVREDCGERGDVARLIEPTGHVCLDQIGDTADAGADDRYGICERLVHNQRPWIGPDCGNHQKINLRVELRRSNDAEPINRQTCGPSF